MHMNFSFTYISFTFMLFGFFYAQNQATLQLKYFDENYQPISKELFDIQKSQHKFLDVTGDSIHHRMLSVREVHGVLENRS